MIERQAISNPPAAVVSCNHETVVPRELHELEHVLRHRSLGIDRVVRVVGQLVEAQLPGCRVGDVLEIELSDRRPGVPIEVVGFRDTTALGMPLMELRGVVAGAPVRPTGRIADVPAGDALLGRVIDPFGRPVDGGPPIETAVRVPVEGRAPAIELRAPVTKPFESGVRVIDALLTCGRGQRVGLFAGAGVGKTLLIRQIAMQSRADVVVLGQIGERGGEVYDLLASSIRARSVVVAATSDRSPMERVRGALVATAIAEHFRARGADVLLVLDSLTRFAMAMREIGLAAGEPPATKGYPPSVFASLPRLLERAAPLAAGGSITGFYTVLVEGDDHLQDPISDSARSLLDGHLVLSRDLAARGHFPALDVLQSASRVAHRVTSGEVQQVARRARGLLALRKEAEELRSLGAYVPGANPAYDEALAFGGRFDQWSRQELSERSGLDPAVAGLARILQPVAAATGRPTA